MQTKTKVSNLLFGLFVRITRMILINAFRATLIVLAYLVRWSISLLELALLLIAMVADKVQVRMFPSEDGAEDMSAPAFSDGEIEVMAMRLPEGANTIEKIADHYGISARQARKIKSACEHRLNVNNYATA